MRAAALAVLCCLAAVATAGAWTSDELGRVVFHADDLRRAGITRPAEVLLLVEDWRPTSMDGYTWRGSMSGLGHYDGQQWQVMIDGKPTAINLFATGALNRLPISMTQIDSVEVIVLPRVHQGRFVDTGLLHFHTVTPDDGWSGSGRVMAGNETGEPGPYQFTELKSPNVERIGPDLSLDVATKGSVGFVRGTYTGLRGYAIDKQTTRRNEAIAGDEELSLHVNGLSLRSGFAVGDTRHDILIGGSAFDDFYFLKPFGREVPVDSRATHAAASGTVPISSRRLVRYRLAFAENRIDMRENTLDLDFDWKQRQADVDVELEHADWRYSVTAGVGVRTATVKTSYTLNRNDYSNARAYADVDFRSSDALQHQIGVMLVAGEDDVAINAAWHLLWTTPRYGALQFVAAYQERLPELDDRIWYWQERGYNFLADNGVAVTRTGASEVAGRLSGDVMWRKKRREWGFEARVFYRALMNQQVESQNYQYDAFDRSFKGPVTVHAGQDGDVGGAKVAVEYDKSGVKARAAYTLQGVPRGDHEFAAAWDAVADQHARVVVSYEVNRKFAVWAQLNYWSATNWVDYRDVEVQSQGAYSVKLRDIVLLDIAFDKWLWRERLRGNILFRNALDRDVRFHPIGASFDLSVFVQVELLLGVPRR